MNSALVHCKLLNQFIHMNLYFLFFLDSSCKWMIQKDDSQISPYIKLFFLSNIVEESGSLKKIC